MANLIVRNVDDAIANALKVQASQHGISAEAEHRRILAQALLRPKKKPFLEALSQIPDVGTDADFVRVQQDGYSDREATSATTNPFD
jgi:antitoxin FitA